jgi:chromatin assembly factor 1 subunit A
LTAEEKEKREKEEAEKKKEREEKMRQKAEDKAKAEKEKAARAAEREEKRKKKEEEDRLKAQQRDEKKQQKEDELRRKAEAEEKKAKSQPSLKSFFGAPRPAKESSAGPANSPQKPAPSSTEAKATVSEYAKMFQPFFVKEHTRIAEPANKMDEETREVKSKILDEYISGQRTHDLSPFDPVKLLELPSRPPRRGCVHHPVRHIMETAYKAMETAQNSGGNEADNIMREARRKLAKIPVKVIAFSRDVRPPYYGTATYKPFLLGRPNLRGLAQKPVDRTLELDYDYDSEAEWQEDEGEDVDVDDDEEELDDEDDMDGFLDDSEDAGLARRIFVNTMEPESTGICFEGDQRQDPIMQDHKMEYIHGKPFH